MAQAESTTLCLLVFTKNNENDAYQIYEQSRDYVDETVLIDSSRESNLAELKSIFRNENVKIYHTIPLGHTEPLRMFALSKIESEWVLFIDADERPSVDLLLRARAAGPEDAYYVPRREVGGYYTKHIRLYRRERARYIGIIHETPQINGRVATLDLNQGLEHLTGFDIAKHRRYAMIEIYTSLLGEVRPGNLLLPLRKLINRSWHKKRTQLIISLIIRLYILVKKPFLAIKNTEEEKEIWSNYLDTIKNEFMKMEPRRRAMALISSIDINRLGSSTSYLKIDDFNYLQNLEYSGHFSDDGLDNFIKLIEMEVGRENILL